VSWLNAPMASQLRTLLVTNLINQVSQLLRAELKELADVAQAMMEPIELCDEG